MAFCSACGSALNEGAAFCSNCGAKVAAPQPVTVVDTFVEEKEFLDVTHRLLRWERKAWSIVGKVFLIFGIIYAALFTVLGIVLSCVGDVVGGISFVMCMFYALFLGGMMIGIGVVGLKSAQKIPFYLDSLYADFRYTYERCGSVGMLVLTVMFGVVSPVFFIINFVRMKANKKLVENILTRQKNFN